MARKDAAVKTDKAEAKAVRPWGYPAHAATKSAVAGKGITEACAPVTRVVAVPVAIIGGFGWGLLRGTYDVLTEMPVLPIDPAVVALAEQLGLTPNQPISTPQVVNVAEVVTAAVTEANAPLIASLSALVAALVAKEAPGAHINGPTPAAAPAA